MTAPISPPLSRAVTGSIPFVLLAAGWYIAPSLIEYPSYMLPPPADVWQRLTEGVADGSLIEFTSESLLRLLMGILIGNGIAIPLGIAIALNRNVSALFLPTLAFMQAIAGIAWIPLAVLWFGIGNGAVIFIVANITFFSVIYSTVSGVESIPLVLRRAVMAHGGTGVGILRELIIPGALVQIILGLRTSVALGWRALVAGEMLAGSGGLGYMTLEAVQWYRTDVVLLGMLLIGVLWLIIDRLVFVPLEKMTIVRWGILQR